MLRRPCSRSHAGAFASHVTAARLYGMPVPPGADEHVTVPAAIGRRRRSSLHGLGGIVCHVDSGAGERMAVRQGVPVSDPARMFTELAGLLDLIDLVVVGDTLVRRRLSTVAELRDAATTSPGHSGRRAQSAAALVRERVDSPMETRTRLLLLFAGLPEPEVNRIVRDSDGTPLRRYDLSWPAARVVVEYDGRHHAERVDQWESDLDRREAVDNSGWRVLVFTSRDIYARPEQAVRRVWEVLRSRGQPGLPRRPLHDWRPHFPGRAQLLD